MDNIKAFFFDLDGTLLDEKQGRKWVLSSKNRDAVAKISKKKLTVISTGRPFNCLQDERKAMGVKYQIAGNGAFIFDENNKLIDYNPMEHSEAQRLMSFIRKNNFSARVNDERVVYKKNFVIAMIVKRFGFSNETWMQYHEPKTFEKVVMFFALKNKASKVAAALTKGFPKLSVAITGGGRMIEITDCNADKGKAALKILAWHNISPENAAHYGDTLNDAPAMKVLEYGFIFKDADPELREFATHIGNYDHTDGGIAKLLNGEYEPLR